MKKRIAVKIVEKLERTVIVEGEDLEVYEAIEIVENLANGEINLGSSDFSGRDVLLSDEFKDGIVPDDADIENYTYVSNTVNTKIKYLYRDGSNYKQWNEEIIKGKLSSEQIEQILECLDDDSYFIPCQVGLSEIRFEKVTDEDHCWFELDKDSFEYVSEAETVDITPDELVKKFKEAAGNWNESLWLEDYEEEEE